MGAALFRVMIILNQANPDPPQAPPVPRGEPAPLPQLPLSGSPPGHSTPPGSHSLAEDVPRRCRESGALLFPRSLTERKLSAVTTAAGFPGHCPLSCHQVPEAICATGESGRDAGKDRLQAVPSLGWKKVILWTGLCLLCTFSRSLGG